MNAAPPMFTAAHPILEDNPAPVILIAADSADTREHLSRLLGARFRVLAACDGAQALELLEQSLPNLVLTDVMMPRVDGFGLLAAVRANPRTRSLPVIILSARGGDEARIGGMEAGADDYLVKPFSARELLARVETHVRLEAVRRKAERTVAQSERQLASELEAMKRLHALSTRLLAASDLTAALSDVLEEAIATCGADFGNIQLFNRQTATLEIVVHRNFQQGFLDYFRTVSVEHGSACSQALQSGRRIVIEDVELDAPFEPHRPIAAATGFRAVNSTPLKAHHGGIVGMLSVHFRTPHLCSERDGYLLDLYARHAADLLERRRVEEAFKEADRRKDEFLAVLAHELRNPLAPLHNGIELARLTVAGDSPLHRTVDMMDRQLHQLVRLVDDLLDVNRISRGKIELRVKPVVIADVLAHSIESCRNVVDMHGHSLEVDVRSDGLMVNGDAERLSQVFSNLITNSAKYTPRGGRIRVSLDQHAAMALVTVSDTGIGIASEDLESIFEMFAQLPPRPQVDRAGLGIGLYLVRALVAMHGGTVKAASAGLGAGSTFVVELPIAETAQPIHRSVAPKPSLVRSPRPLHILVADDNVDAADSLGELLRLAGHEVTIANDGLEAVRQASRKPFHVAFLDIGMPGLDGVEAAKRIRSLPDHLDTLIVAVTGWGQERDRERTKAAGIDVHIIKPVDVEAIRSVLANRFPEQRARPR